jgi:predicted RecA/RadA family phage recombinase
MATNYKQEGQIMEYANAGSAISSGDFVVIGNRVGCAITDIAATTGTGSVQLEGVFSGSKDGDEAFAQGDALFFDASDSTFTKTATGNTWAGSAFETATEASTSCVVKLEPNAKQAAIVAFSAGTNLTALVPAASTIADVSTGGGNTYADSVINAMIVEIKSALLLKADNTDVETLRTEEETRQDAQDTAIAAIIAALKAAGLMANS